MSVAGTSFPSVAAFWTAVSGQVKACNHPTYHPCCKVWTHRRQSQLKATHSQSVSWGQVLKEVGCIQTEPVVLLQAHMIENGWGPPIYLNVKCRYYRTIHVREVPGQPVQLTEHINPASGVYLLGRGPVEPTSPMSTPAPPIDLMAPMRSGSQAEDANLKSQLDSGSQIPSAE